MSPRPQDAERQSARAVVMIEPAAFGANPETRASNSFQTADDGEKDARLAARLEFDRLALALEAAGVRVLRFAGHSDRPLPDEVFPNNWFSTHADGTLVTYPLAAANRRPERREDVIERLRGEYVIRRHVELSSAESRGEYLEGTGSLVLDRLHRVAYACRSVRTSAALAGRLTNALGYELELFDAVDRNGHAIYHTNVMLAIGTRFAVLATAPIADPAAAARIRARLAATGRDIIEIDTEQLHAFAGNLLELRGSAGPVIALSRQARTSLDIDQLAALARCGELIDVDIETIERLGGGSVRCMLAEVHLPQRAMLPQGIVTSGSPPQMAR